MIKVGGRYHETLTLTFDTERMLSQVRLARLLPLVAVATLGAGLTLPFAPLGLGTFSDVRVFVTVAGVAGQHVAALSSARLLRSWGHLLFALTANYLGVDLVSARVEQLDGLVLELPHITIQAKVGVALVNPLARDQLRGFNPYGLGLCHHRRLCRAGRQAEAEQPSHEQAYCCV